MTVTPYSYREYTGNGANRDFQVPFPYLLKAHVKVYTGLNLATGAYTTLLVDGTDYSWTSTTNVQLTTAPAAGVKVTVKRETPTSDLLTQWQDGSTQIAEDLLTSDKQNLYAVQEEQDLLDVGVALSVSATTAAATATATANAATTTANTSLTQSGTALTQSSTALTQSGQAVTASSNAVTTANASSASAASAVSTANAASASASTALATANTANSKADQAISAVSNSINYTLVANVAGIPASPANDTYVEAGNSTGIESFTPLAGKPAGFIGDSGLSVRMRYTTAGATWNWQNYYPNNAETRYLKLSGGTLTGPLTLAGAPSSNLHPATKAYVDGYVGSINGDIASLSSAKLDSATAASTYQPISGMSSYLTTSAASSTYLTSATASSTYQTQAGMSGYLPKAGGTMTGAITFASGQTISGYAALATAQTFTAAQRGSVSALTDGATITPDFAVANNFSVTLGGSRTLANPTNLTAGQSGTIVITNGGAYTLAFGSYWKFAGGTAPTLTASATDVIAYYVESATRITARHIGDVK